MIIRLYQLGQPEPGTLPITPNIPVTS